MFENGVEPIKKTEFINDYLDKWSYLSIGAYATDTGQWTTVKNEPFPYNNYSSLWGPYETAGDGWCGVMILVEKWYALWKGKGWRINDGGCLNQAFICQREKHNSSKDVGYCI